MPTMPSSNAMMQMVSPLIVGWITIRNRCNWLAISISNSPAHTVMQATAGCPPALAAMIDGPR